ncbi:unnamed protein product [Trifolium pratense]|uniref:Uncharacterized protein n=1 Tax=Trifolium pratense TaxID=57577 RepID=A0ACB0IW97_TRIPR|nr:unnamed protein product [Trifolium pratense]
MLWCCYPCFSLWGDENCEWAFLASEGSSGGILSLRNKFFIASVAANCYFLWMWFCYPVSIRCCCDLLYLCVLVLLSGSHPSTIRVDEDLNKLKTWEGTSTSTSTSRSIHNGLSLLENLYISLEDLLNMTSTQQVISHHRSEKCIEDVLDGSMKILDICSITRDTILQIKENVQVLHSSIRRRKCDSSVERSVVEYKHFTKKMKKNVNKLIKTLKHMDSKFGVSTILELDNHFSSMIRVFREVIITMLNSDNTVDATVQPFVVVNDHVSPSDKSISDSIVELVTFSIKGNITTLDVAQDVGTSSVQPNPNDATITESFGDSCDFEATTGDELQDKENNDIPADVIEDSKTEDSIEKVVSLGDKDIESEKTVNEEQEMIDLDELEEAALEATDADVDENLSVGAGGDNEEEALRLKMREMIPQDSASV